MCNLDSTYLCNLLLRALNRVPPCEFRWRILPSTRVLDRNSIGTRRVRLPASRSITTHQIQFVLILTGLYATIAKERFSNREYLVLFSALEFPLAISSTLPHAHLLLNFLWVPFVFCSRDALILRLALCVQQIYGSPFTSPLFSSHINRTPSKFTQLLLQYLFDPITPRRTHTVAPPLIYTRFIPPSRTDQETKSRYLTHATKTGWPRRGDLGKA